MSEAGKGVRPAPHSQQFRDNWQRAFGGPKCGDCVNWTPCSACGDGMCKLSGLCDDEWTSETKACDDRFERKIKEES